MRSEPIFNAPTVVVALATVFVAVHGVFSILPHDQADTLFVELALVPARYGALGGRIPGSSFAAWTSPFTHLFLHADWGHLLINIGWLLAFGSAIARRTGGVRMLALFILSGLGGALLYVLLHPQELSSLVGASGGLSGLMGGVFRFLFRALDRGGGAGLETSAADVPLMTIRETLAEPRVRLALGAWFAVNLVLGLLPPGLLTEGVIAWEAHLGGFLVGFFAMACFERNPASSSRLER